MFRRLLYCLFALSAWPQLRADVILSIFPTSQTVSLGSPATFTLNISGLGGGTALGTYDISLGFDPALFSYTSTLFGNQLDLFGLGDIQSTTVGGGLINLFELSLESIADLNSLQATQFTLATLTFDSIATGSNSPLTLSVNALGDASGNSIAANLQDGSVSIAPVSATPEPQTVIMLVTGLLGLVTIRRFLARRRSAKLGQERNAIR